MNYISNAQEHNRSTPVTKVTTPLGIPQEIKNILQHLQSVFYTGLVLTENDIVMLSDTHRINVQLLFDTSVITSMYWFYIFFRVYIRGPADINTLELRCVRTSQSYIDRLVLYTNTMSIPFETGMQCLLRIHQILGNSSEHIINTLIQRSIDKIKLVDTYTQEHSTLMGEALCKKDRTVDTHTRIPSQETRRCHPKDFPDVSVSKDNAFEAYRRFTLGEITEAEFSRIVYRLCIIDMYRCMPVNSKVTAEFLAEYNECL